MSELPITPFPAGLTTLGAQDADVCVDGVCFVPEDAAEAERDATGG